MAELSVSRRTRSTPFTAYVEAQGVKGYTVYNHMLLPTYFRSVEEDYWHLCQHVQVWDVSCERQVSIQGPDASKLVQLMTPRDLSKAREERCFYVPLCDVDGGLVNDPIAIKHSSEHWWLSIADSDVLLWAKGLATGFGLDVVVEEPDVWPLAVQGPKAELLMSRVFGEQVVDIRFFHFKRLEYRGHNFVVARSGWSKQGGFEIYVDDAELGRQLWCELFDKGEDLNVGPGCPNLIERIESGLLSFGNDMGYKDNPLESGLAGYVDLAADINSLSLEALRNTPLSSQLLGAISSEQLAMADAVIYQQGREVGQVTSACWSPKYQLSLALVRCSAAIDKQSPVTLNSADGPELKLADLPFDFAALGFSAQQTGE